MVDTVKVGDVDPQVLADGRVGVDTVLAVWNGLIAVEEAGTLSREGQHGIGGVAGRTVDVEINEIDVPRPRNCR